MLYSKYGMSNWFVGSEEIDHAPFIEDFTGVVYIITNTLTGQKYIGQKTFLKRIKKAPLKGQKRNRISYRDNDFLEYYGSSDSLNADVAAFGKAAFRREIIRFCKTKSEQNYYEAKEIFDRNALMDPLYYNKWVSVKIGVRQLGIVK